MGNHALEMSAVVEEWSVVQPAVGTEFSITVPTGRAWKFETGFFTLATSAVVANRIVKIQITDASNNVVWQGGIQTTFTASQTALIGLTRLGGQAAASGSNVPDVVDIPDVWLPAGYVLKTLTTALDVGDQYSAAHGLVSASTAL